MIRGRLADEQGNVVIPEALKAEGMFERLRGLLAREALRGDQAMVLEPCNSVHTIAMHYSLDIVFVSADGTVLKIVESLKPYRYTCCFAATATIEMAAGAASGLRLTTGSTLQWAPAG